MARQINYQDINNLIDRVRAGDDAAISEAQDLSVALSKRANTRLRALESEGFTSGHAYERAKYFLDEDMDRSYFSQSKKLEGEKLVENLELAADFLQSPESSVNYERNRRAGIEDMEDILPDDFSDYKKRQLRSFLGSDAWQEYKSTIYIHRNTKTAAESSEARAAIAGAADAISRGASVSDLINLYEKYQDQITQGEDTSIFDVFEEWEEF